MVGAPAPAGDGRLRQLRSYGRRAVLAAALLGLGAPPAALAAAAAVVPGKACERAHVRRLVLSDPAHPDTLTVRATGPSCQAAKIIVTLRSAAGRTLWSEQVFLSGVEFGLSPDEPGPEITFEFVTGAVETWVSLEQSSEAPPWPGPGPAPLGPPAPGQLEYDTKLDRAQYERIRAAHAPMLCIPVGPEAGHCIARDPATGRLVEFFGRGL